MALVDASYQNGSVVEYYEDDEEMPATERELAEDAPWKQIQKNTFTRWCNEHLKCVNKRIANLETDLSDGLRLIALLEVLSHQKMARYNKRPNFRQMKLENVSVALKFLEREHIRLVSIDSKAIVDGNLKLILGLIWTLILHYSISMPMWDEDDESAVELAAQQTPKQRLLTWIQNKIPEMPITNFKSNWQDGLALGALVDNCAPGMCPEWVNWDPANKLENTTHAMNVADDKLGCAQVIAPEEITNPDVDELSVMTYLSQFPKAVLKPGAPLRPKTNAKKVRAYGKGVEATGNKIGMTAPITIETIGAGKGDVVVMLTDPDGQQQQLKTKANNDRLLTYSCAYTPTTPGNYEVSISFADSAISKSPFVVTVEDSPANPAAVWAKGPGLSPGNVVNATTHFDIFTDNAGIGEITVSITGPNGESVQPSIQQVEPCLYRVSYTPTVNGIHKVQITFAGESIPKSPYTVDISLPLDASAVWAEGPGLEAEGVMVKKQATFVVHTEKAGSAKVEVKCLGPNGVQEPVNVTDNKDGTYSCSYFPRKAGQYQVLINFAGQATSKSPYKINVDTPPDPSKVRLTGPGVQTGNMVGVSTYFDVITTGAATPKEAEAGVAALEVALTNQKGSKVPFEIEDRGNGVFRVTYTPKSSGSHKLNVTFAGHAVPKTPMTVEILAAFDASACKVYGRGVQPTGVRMREKSQFYVIIEGAGDAPIKIKVLGPDGMAVPVTCNKTSPTRYDCDYYPLKVGQHRVDVTWGGKHVPKSPFQVNIAQEAGKQKVRAFGPGLSGGMVDYPAEFVVETTGEDVGQLGFSIEGPSQAPIECVDKGDGSCDVSYLPTVEGEYAIHVICDDEDIKMSPFMAMIVPNDSTTLCDAVKAYGPGLESGVPVKGEPVSFTVDTKDAGGKAKVACIVSAEGKQLETEIKNNGDGTTTVTYTPIAPAKHTIIPTYNGVRVKDSPFRVVAQPAPEKKKQEPVPVQEAPVAQKAAEPVQEQAVQQQQEQPVQQAVQQEVNANEASYPGKVTVSGPGVSSGVKDNEQTYFTVDCSQAGLGDVSINIKCAPGVAGPDARDVDFEIVRNEQTDTFTVKYTPAGAGQHVITVLFANQPVPQSPFIIVVDSTHNAAECIASGPGIEKNSTKLVDQPTSPSMLGKQERQNQALHSLHQLLTHTLLITEMIPTLSSTHQKWLVRWMLKFPMVVMRLQTVRSVLKLHLLSTSTPSLYPDFKMELNGKKMILHLILKTQIVLILTILMITRTQMIPIRTQMIPIRNQMFPIRTQKIPIRTQKIPIPVNHMETI